MPSPERRSRTPPLLPLCGWARVCKQRASCVEIDNALGGKPRYSAQTSSLHVVLASQRAFQQNGVLVVLGRRSAQKILLGIRAVLYLYDHDRTHANARMVAPR